MPSVRLCLELDLVAAQIRLDLYFLRAREGFASKAQFFAIDRIPDEKVDTNVYLGSHNCSELDYPSLWLAFDWPDC